MSRQRLNLSLYGLSLSSKMGEAWGKVGHNNTEHFLHDYMKNCVRLSFPAFGSLQV